MSKPCWLELAGMRCLQWEERPWEATRGKNGPRAHPTLQVISNCLLRTAEDRELQGCCSTEAAKTWGPIWAARAASSPRGYQIPHGSPSPRRPSSTSPPDSSAACPTPACSGCRCAESDQPALTAGPVGWVMAQSQGALKVWVQSGLGELKAHPPRFLHPGLWQQLSSWKQ